MSVARQNHVAALLKNGSVLVAESHSGMREGVAWPSAPATLPTPKGVLHPGGLQHLE